MTETVEVEATERVPLVRRFETEITAGDGRTVVLRVVPFGETAIAADGLGGVPKGVPYREEWLPGVFDKQLNAANRILLNFEHQLGIAGVVGHGTRLERRADGYVGTFRIHPSADGDKALLMVNEGVLGGASLEAYPRKSVRSKTGVVQRVLGILDSVALCRKPAFDGAVILAVREEDELVFDEELLPLEFDPALAARAEAIGIAIPARLKAHPATDTPDDSGTPETTPAADTETEPKGD